MCQGERSFVVTPQLCQRLSDTHGRRHRSKLTYEGLRPSGRHHGCLVDFPEEIVEMDMLFIDLAQFQPIEDECPTLVRVLKMSIGRRAEVIRYF